MDLLHGNLESDICAVLSDVPETTQVLSVDSSEEIV